MVGVYATKLRTAARVLALGVILPFAVITTTSANAGDDKKGGGVVNDAAKVAAAGAILTGVSAKTGAAVGAVAGGVRKGKDKDQKDKK